MLQDLLAQRVQPIAERFADELATLLMKRIERDLERIGEAFEVALSAFVHELEDEDVREAGQASPVGIVPEPAILAEQGSTLILGGEVAHSATEQTPLSTSMVPSRPNGDSDRAAAPARTDGERKRKPNTCSKCGASGFTAQSCGKTHNVSTSPAAAAVASRDRGSEASPPATSVTAVDCKPPPHQPLGSLRCNRSVRSEAKLQSCSTGRRTAARSFARCRTFTGSTAD